MYLLLIIKPSSARCFISIPPENVFFPENTKMEHWTKMGYEISVTFDKNTQEHHFIFFQFFSGSFDSSICFANNLLLPYFIYLKSTEDNVLSSIFTHLCQTCFYIKVREN